MKLKNKVLIPLTVLCASTLFFGCSKLKNLRVQKEAPSTSEIYGENINYSDLSEILEGNISDRKIKLPPNLEKYLTAQIHNNQTEEEQFKKDFWKEAHKLKYSPEKFKNMDFEEAILSIVEVIESKFEEALDVDNDTEFIKKYGEDLPISTYFRLGIGDCERYRDATIEALRIIKGINPRLKNVYISDENLGGNIQPHAWNSILIIKDSQIILSHIEPTLYDTEGHEYLEADDYHIDLQDKIYLAGFYESLDEDKFAYNLLKKMLDKPQSKERIELILDRMGDSCSMISFDNPEEALQKFNKVMKHYEALNFTKNLDNVLYNAYEINKSAGNPKKAERYKQRLIKEFPDSYWIDSLKD